MLEFAVGIAVGGVLMWLARPVRIIEIEREPEMPKPKNRTMWG